MLVRILVGIALLALLAYGCIKAWPLVSGPEIRLSSPVDGATAADGFVTIEGQARHTETLMLDSGPLLMDEDGNFSRTLLLPKGGSILTLTAADRFGRRAALTRMVFVPGSASASATSSPASAGTSTPRAVR